MASIMGYWRTTGYPWIATQAMLEEHVVKTVGVYERTFRNVLYRLARKGIVELREVNSLTILVQLDQRRVPPTWPGYCSQSDRGLVDPLSWVEPDGRFFRFGRPRGRAPFVARLNVQRMHLGEFVWMRSWIHALNAGLFAALDLDDSLTLVRSLAHEAVTAYAWTEAQGSASNPAHTRLISRLQTAPFRKLTRAPHARAASQKPDAIVARDALRAIEEAYCPHGPRQGGSSRAALHREVYQELDLLIGVRLQEKLAALDQRVKFFADRAHASMQGQPRRKNATSVRANPRFRVLGPAIRAQPPPVRASLLHSERAWGYRGLITD